LALRYFHGTGVEKNKELAKEKLEAAYHNKTCEYTFRAALYLGIIFLDSNEQEDKAKAYKWIKIAADNGNGPPEAMKILAKMYKRGIGVDPNTEESEKWQSLYDKKKGPTDEPEEEDDEDDANLSRGVPDNDDSQRQMMEQMMLGQGAKKFEWDRWAVLKVVLGFSMMSLYFFSSNGHRKVMGNM